MEKTVFTLCRLQQQIRDFLQCNPGLHSRELSHILNIPFSTAHYHLVRLEKQNILRCDRVGKYARYYVSDTIGIDESRILSMMKNKTQKQIMALLVVKTTASKEEFGHCLQKHPTTIMFHVKKLLERDIIISQTCSDDVLKSKEKTKGINHTNSGKNNKRYRLKNPDLVARLIQKYDSCSRSVNK